MDELDLRRHVYRTLADTGLAPTAAEIAELVGGPEAAAEHLQRLEDRHFVVLGPDGEISMALPFAARPTGHRVLNGSRSWWANCAWDSLAIPAALHADAEIEARWLDDDTPSTSGSRTDVRPARRAMDSSTSRSRPGTGGMTSSRHERTSASSGRRKGSTAG